MPKKYTEQELIDMGMDTAQIKALLAIQGDEPATQMEVVDVEPIVEEKANVVQLHKHEVVVETKTREPLVPTTIAQIASYKDGAVVQLPPFADGQPFVARMKRPSMLALVKSGQIPNTLMNQATSLFANGAGALGGSGKNATSISDLFDVIDKIVEAALLEPTLKDIRDAGMELTDDQLLAIFSYTQQGVKALEQFRTK